MADASQWLRPRMSASDSIPRVLPRVPDDVSQYAGTVRHPEVAPLTGQLAIPGRAPQLRCISQWREGR